LKLYLLANLGTEARSGRREVASLAGASMSVRRRALEAVGGFDPAIRFGGEDEDFFYRLRQQFPAAKLIFDPAAQMEHYFSGGTADMLRRARCYGRGNARNFVKHPDWGPTVFPAPLAFLALVLTGSRWRWSLAAAALLPIAVSPRWAIGALRRRDPGVVLLAWLQLLEEAACDVGFVSGYLRARHQLGARR
jgi:GT2 family glycosyltransferase